ncbi:ras GEF [Ramicandelaber brevisporus]|nr:ras GEF [Ramicandelaber brevisporus]
MDDSGSALYALPDSTASNNISNGASSVNNIADGNNIEFDNNEDKYPPNWIRKLTIIRAKPYYVNLLADLSAWSLENVQSDTGLDERAADIAERSTSVPLAGLATSIVNSDGNYTLDSLVSNVAYSLKRLGQSVYEGRRREYLSFSDAVVDAVRLLFEACGISDRHSAVLKMHRLLRAHHRGVSVALSQFVRHAKEASSLWSPPDAASRMMNDANEVLLNSRHFATLADECKVGVDTLAVARHVELKMTHHEAIIVSTQLETFAINLARAISLMLRFIRLGLSSDPAIKQQQQQQQQQQQGGVNPENGVYSPTRLVAHAKHVVTEVGSFLAFVEQYDEEVVMNPAIGVVGSPAAADFSSSRQRVFRDVTSLVMAAQSAAGVGPSALTGSDNSINNSTANIQSEAVHPRVSAWASVESACETLDLALRDLVISFKKVIESRDMILYTTLVAPSSASMPSSISTQSRPTDKPWYLNFDHEPNEIVFNSDGNIRGGTLRALIERLTAHEGSDTNFNTTVLLTYRTFTTTDVFLDLLISRYTITAPPGLREEEMRIWRDQKMLPIRLRVFNVMRTWLENYYIEAEEDGDALVKLKNFASTELANSKPRWAEQLIRAIDMRRHASDGFLKRLVPNTASNMPASILPRGFGQKKLKLLDIDPLELARQLTLAEFKIYGGIRFIEFLNQGWQTRNAPNTSANIKQMAERSTRFTNWVGSLILEESDLRRRANVVKYLITVGYHCLTLNNFSTLMSMNGALDSAPIGRLRRTWDQLPQRTLQQQEAMRKAMNPSRNSMAYRDALHSANPPCLPFLGIHLSDITFTDEGNQNMISGREGLINITKRSILSESIRDVLQYQNTPYRFNEVKEIQDYVATCLDNVDEMQDLYTRSLELEPREAEDAKIQRLLRESGFL